MQFIETKTSEDYLALAKSLAEEFAQSAVARDVKGGTPKQERDRYCQSYHYQSWSSHYQPYL